MSLDSYRRNAGRLRDNISNLQKDKAKEVKNASDAYSRMNVAQQAANKSKTTSTIKSKMNEAERYSKKYSIGQENVSKIESKISAKQKELDRAIEKIEKEEKRLDEQKIKDENERMKEQEKRYRDMNKVIEQHENIQNQMKQDISQLKIVPEKIKVLFFAVNPKDTDRLRLDEEARNIRDTIAKSKHRDSVIFETRWAVRPMDLLQAINEVNPTIIHFSGHGSMTGDLALEDNDGQAKLVSSDAITQAITTISDTVRFAFFDACHSAPQAQAVIDYIDGAIGMTDSIGDQAAIAFSSQFYSAIGFGLSVSKAFQQAKAILMMEYPDEVNTPELFVKEELDADELVIVAPTEID